MLFINNYHKERQDAPEQFLVPIFQVYKDTFFSPSHRFHKDSGVSNPAECAAVAPQLQGVMGTRSERLKECFLRKID